MIEFFSDFLKNIIVFFAFVLLFYFVIDSENKFQKSIKEENDQKNMNIGLFSKYSLIPIYPGKYKNTKNIKVKKFYSKYSKRLFFGCLLSLLIMVVISTI